MSGFNVIYDKQTCRVILTEENGYWTLPMYLDVAHYEEGSEPVLIESKDGGLYLRPNAVIVNDLWGGKDE